MVLDAKQKREVKHGTCFQADFHAAVLYVYADFFFYTLQLLCSVVLSQLPMTTMRVLVTPENFLM